MNLEGFNDRQRDAVLAPLDKPALVLAGAGSGKTRVLIYRIAYLIKNGVDPSTIMAVTFTNKAANEIKDRLSDIIGPQSRNVWAGTLHGICLRLLRVYSSHIGYRNNFSIYDEADSDKLLRDILKERLSAISIGSLSTAIGNYKNNLILPEEAIASAEGNYQKEVAEMYRIYQDRLMANNAMDFDDMINNMVFLMRSREDIKEKIQYMLQYLLVDEHQDINPAQHEFLVLIAEKSRRIFVVGDDWQCFAFGSRVRLADKSTKKVEELAVGDMIQTIYNGRVSYSPVTNMKVNVKSTIIEVKTESGHTMRVTTNHKCFASLPDFRGLHYVYIMWKSNKGFRIGVVSGSLSKIANSRLFLEGSSKLWLIGQSEDLSKMKLLKERLSLLYKIPKVPCLSNGRETELQQKDIDRFFLEFGDNGQRLLDVIGYNFDYPHFATQGLEKDTGRKKSVNLYMGNRKGSCLVAFEGEGQKLAKQFSSANAYKDAQEFAYMLAKEVNASGVTEEFVTTGKKHLKVIPASSLMKTMQIPVVIEGKVRLSKIVSITRHEPEPSVDLEVAQTGIVIADDVVSHNSIYKFRGADIENILNFEKDFPEATVVKLEQNYRSTQVIVRASNSVIANNKNQMEKKLWTGNDVGEKISVKSNFSDGSEATWVASKIREIYNNGQDDLSQIAILYRANFQSRVLERELLGLGIPYEMVGGISFFQRKEIKDIIAYLRVAVNNEDAVSLERIINIPKRGIGDASVKKIAEHADQNSIPLFLAVKEAENIKGLGKRQHQLENLVDIITKIGEQGSVESSIKFLIKETGYMEYLGDYSPDDYSDREENIEELLRMAHDYDNKNIDCNLSNFLQEISLQKEADAVDTIKGTVKLMTVHNSKGLEFKTVFCVGLEEGIFPHQKSIEDNDIEEERRLFYVATSRAEEKLYLTHADTRQRYGDIFESSPSRFLSEIPEELIIEE